MASPSRSSGSRPSTSLYQAMARPRSAAANSNFRVNLMTPPTREPTLNIAPRACQGGSLGRGLPVGGARLSGGCEANDPAAVGVHHVDVTQEVPRTTPESDLRAVRRPCWSELSVLDRPPSVGEDRGRSSDGRQVEPIPLVASGVGDPDSVGRPGRGRLVPSIG